MQTQKQDKPIKKISKPATSSSARANGLGTAIYISQETVTALLSLYGEWYAQVQLRNARSGDVAVKEALRQARKKNEPHLRIGCFLPRDLHALLEATAAADSRSRNAVVARTLQLATSGKTWITVKHIMTQARGLALDGQEPVPNMNFIVIAAIRWGLTILTAEGGEA